VRHDHVRRRWGVGGRRGTVQYARVEPTSDSGCFARGGGSSIRRIFSELDEHERQFLLMVTDFGIAVCGAKLMIHLISLFVA
jgi:hypothetical protein